MALAWILAEFAVASAAAYGVIVWRGVLTEHTLRGVNAVVQRNIRHRTQAN